MGIRIGMRGPRFRKWGMSGKNTDFFFKCLSRSASGDRSRAVLSDFLSISIGQACHSTTILKLNDNVNVNMKWVNVEASLSSGEGRCFESLLWLECLKMILLQLLLILSRICPTSRS